MKLGLLLILNAVKNNIETRAKHSWYYQYVPLKLARGFTLAEVLITLLIIVTVAFGYSALVQDSQDAELKTALKSFYSTISNDTKLIKMENGITVKGLITNIFYL